MINLSIQGGLVKDIWSFCGIKIKNPWGAGKFNPMWHGPYIFKCVLEKGTYELVHYEGTALAEPRNGLYLKKYYA